MCVEQKALPTGISNGVVVCALGAGEREDPLNREARSSHDLFRPTPTMVLAFVALAAIFAAYFAFIHHYAVDAIFYDQWWDVQILGHWYSGTLSFSDLWAQHGENRILFPNLVMLLLARSVHLNTVVEQYLSGFLLITSTLLIIGAHKRRSPAINWLWYVPAAALLVSYVQYQDALWGFQLAWYMVYFCLAASLFLLDRPRLSWPVFVVALSLAIVGSYSSLQGLLIWAVGLSLMYQRNRSRQMNLAWLSCAVVAGVIYFYNLSLSNNNVSYVFTHPVTAAKYYFLSIGDVLGIGVSSNPDAGTYALMVLGLVIFLMSCWVLISFGSQRDETSGAPFGVALTAYGLLFAALVTSDRAAQGLAGAAQSRYTTFDLLIPVGCYLTLLSAWTRPARPTVPGKTARSRSRVTLRLVTAVLLVVIGLQLIIGPYHGLTQAHWWSEDMQQAANVTVDGTKTTEVYQASVLLPTCQCLQFDALLPRLVQVVREHRLSMFGTGDAAIYAKEGFSRTTIVPPRTRIVRPTSGKSLRGKVWLVATATAAPYGIARVEFLLSGGTLHDVRIATATLVDFGWLAGWNTATVPKGSYELQSIAYESTGKSAESPVVEVQVGNR